MRWGGWLMGCLIGLVGLEGVAIAHPTSVLLQPRQIHAIIRRQPRPGRSLLRPPEAPAPSNREGCVVLTVMANLAYLENPYAELTDEVSGRQVSLCRGRDSASTGVPQWDNRRPLRFGDRWYYPNGTAAQFSDNWNYPNGRLATFGSSWYYPNGRTARFGSSWYTPGGRSVSESALLGEACEAVGSRRCRSRLEEVQGAGDFWYELAIVQLAWLGYQIERGEIAPN